MQSLLEQLSHLGIGNLFLYALFIHQPPKNAQFCPTGCKGLRLDATGCNEEANNCAVPCRLIAVETIKIFPAIGQKNQNPLLQPFTVFFYGRL